MALCANTEVNLRLLFPRLRFFNIRSQSNIVSCRPSATINLVRSIRSLPKSVRDSLPANDSAGNIPALCTGLEACHQETTREPARDSLKASTNPSPLCVLARSICQLRQCAIAPGVADPDATNSSSTTMGSFAHLEFSMFRNDRGEATGLGGATRKSGFSRMVRRCLSVA